ncbi:hypothetical protein C3747_120g57 [Trypanosoma cruzi]|uniref:Uncharacterized protein n=2 Tax=Trypanosoma cruzi TaxID=5693 RepID=Q4CTP9_TRYCC|nr:hypothetical protein, conserved [Trypanosoma cruzi]EAN83653.1 hypothetical protein, conserved [Trypanosoma cruzi]PWV06112.1 hypothetical protein C3747_120g57 [Trypanosoma cruzi]RNC48235.1 hypothetical protein TcCL_NonESM01831 [Trypanosoma cruzi]|eukprot:XP_805504.1 hypothetical protein [Trypanosoma cruzi strain CL Brener]
MMPCRADCCSHENEVVEAQFAGWDSCTATQEVPAAEEECLDIDYAAEIEESSRYVFSQRPYCRNTALAVCGGDGEQGEFCGVREEEQEQPVRELQSHVFVTRGERVQLQDDTLSPSDRRASLVFLMGEARRRHLALLSRHGASEGSVMEAIRQWRAFARRFLDELDRWGHEHARRMLSNMFLFELPGKSCNLLDSGARVRELIRNKERVLQELRERNQLFLTAEANLPQMDTSPCVSMASEGEELEMFPTAADSLSLMAMAQLNDPSFAKFQEGREVELCEFFSFSLDTSLKSGEGASSSDCSSDTDEYADACRSPPSTTGDLWLSAPCQ